MIKYLIIIYLSLFVGITTGMGIICGKFKFKYYLDKASTPLYLDLTYAILYLPLATLIHFIYRKIRKKNDVVVETEINVPIKDEDKLKMFED